MSVRLLVIATAVTIGTSALAEPPKTTDRETGQRVSRPAEVVLASADQVRTPDQVAQQNAAPVKRPRVGRVTSCRCGDQQAQPDE
jgi:hypothetical protein